MSQPSPYRRVPATQRSRNDFYTPPPKKNRPDSRLFIIFGGLFILLLISVVLIIAAIIGNFSNPATTSDDSQNNSGNINIPKGSEYTRPLTKSNDPKPREWDGNSRVTVLVMGLDSRDNDSSASRTDSMILFSMDPVNHTAGMLSIPRDMWVTIPGYGEDKINTAYFKGELDQNPGAGPGLAIKTVDGLIGMPINYFAQIDFNAFSKFIDEIGGVDIKVKEAMVIDPVGPNNTIFLKPGTQTFNGAQALAYARVRDMGHGDFDRAARQQQVIMAVRDNILNYYSLPKLIMKAPAIYNDIASGVRTNMTLQDAIRMGIIVQQIKMENIQRGVINEPDQVTASMSWAGEYILLPDMDAVFDLRNQVFGKVATLPTPSAAKPNPNAAKNEANPGENAAQQPAANTPPTPEPVPTQTPAITLSPQDAAKAEKAQVIVYNGTEIPGLAARTHEFLMLKGIRVAKEANADNKVDYTEIRVSSDKQATVRYLADLLKVSPSRIFDQSADPNDPADIVVILGSDWAVNNNMP